MPTLRLATAQKQGEILPVVPRALGDSGDGGGGYPGGSDGSTPAGEYGDPGGGDGGGSSAPSTPSGEYGESGGTSYGGGGDGSTPAGEYGEPGPVWGPGISGGPFGESAGSGNFGSTLAVWGPGMAPSGGLPRSAFAGGLPYEGGGATRRYTGSSGRLGSGGSGGRGSIPASNRAVLGNDDDTPRESQAMLAQQAFLNKQRMILQGPPARMLTPRVTAGQLEIPEYDNQRVEALAQRAAAPGIRKLRDQVQQVQGANPENPNVKAMNLRQALAGYGSGLETVMGGALSAGTSMYGQEYDPQVAEATTNYQGNLQRELESERRYAQSWNAWINAWS